MLQRAWYPKTKKLHGNYELAGKIAFVLSLDFRTHNKEIPWKLWTCRENSAFVLSLDFNTQSMIDLFHLMLKSLSKRPPIDFRYHLKTNRVHENYELRCRRNGIVSSMTGGSVKQLLYQYFRDNKTHIQDTREGKLLLQNLIADVLVSLNILPLLMYNVLFLSLYSLAPSHV